MHNPWQHVSQDDAKRLSSPQANAIPGCLRALRIRRLANVRHWRQLPAQSATSNRENAGPEGSYHVKDQSKEVHTPRQVPRSMPGGDRPCENFLFSFKAGPPGPLAPPRRPAGPAPVGWRESKTPGAAINQEVFRAASGFDKGSLAMAHIGLTGARSQPDSPTSVRAIAPCQIPPLRPPTALPWCPLRFNALALK